MTSKVIYYHSITGNTKAILDDIIGFDMYDMTTCKYNFKKYDVIVIGLPSYSRGIPHEDTWDFIREIIYIKNKKIGLFGSGNSIFGDAYCGALDILEEQLKVHNDILFKYKYESYPLDEVKEVFMKILKEKC